MIRISVNNDKEGIVSLWHEAFGDSRDEIMFFLNSKYKLENTLVYEKNGETASMLFLLEGDMRINGKDYPSYYLYAACTANKYRGQGLMSSLLEFAKETAKNRNKYFICLMPAEKSLFNYYEKFGYKPTFKQKNLSVNRNDIKSLEADTLFNSMLADIDLAKLRNTAFEKFDFFKWNSNAIDFAFKHNRLYFGNDFCACEGYLLYSKDDDKASVREFAFTEDNFISALNKLFVLSDCENLQIKLPAGYETPVGNFEIADSAMMLALNEDAENLMKEIKNAYLGLTLD